MKSRLRRQNLHINGKFFFPENLSTRLDAWCSSRSNTVHQPLTSFTAVRGFAGWVNGQQWAQPIKLSPPANQMFHLGALKALAISSHALARSGTLSSGSPCEQLTAGLSAQPVLAERNAKDGFASLGSLDVTNNQIMLVGEPMISPYVSAIHEPAGYFLLAGGFPNSFKSKPLPPELFRRLATPNLVFFHWEITAERLPLQLNLSRLTLMVDAAQTA